LHKSLFVNYEHFSASTTSFWMSDVISQTLGSPDFDIYYYLKSSSPHPRGLPQIRHGNLPTYHLYPFIPNISIALLQVHYYSEALPTTALVLCRS